MNDRTDDVINNIVTARKTLKISKCVFSKFVNSDESQFCKSLKWCRMKSDEEQDIVIPVDKEDVVIEKMRYSALTDELKTMLINGSFDTIYLCGLETDACVLATAFDLFDFGITPKILIDCCASARGKEYHDAAQKIMERSFGINNIIKLLDCKGE